MLLEDKDTGESNWRSSASKTTPRGWELGVEGGRGVRDGTLGGRSTDALGDTGGDDDDLLFLVRERRCIRRGDSRPLLPLQLLATVDDDAADITDGATDMGEAATLRWVLF